MLIEQIRPSTLIGIKRLAKRIKQVEGIGHNQALNRAARAASFENFEHARRQLTDELTTNKLFLTAYWTDNDTHESGRETLDITLSVPLEDICTKAELRLVRGLARTRLAASDHLVTDRLWPSQAFARDQLCMAVRYIRFMETTGLRPSDYLRTERCMKGVDSDLPDNDHISQWYDPPTDQFILVDEPYLDPDDSPERTLWAVRNNWQIRASDWPGAYFPYRCTMFVACKISDSFDFEALMKKIDGIPDPLISDDWVGISTNNHALFVSPLAKSKADKRRAKAKGTVVARPSTKTVPYWRDLIGASRKPNGAMSLEEHIRAGRMIHALLQSEFKPWKVNWRLQKLQMTLVDWLYADIPYHVLNAMDDPIDIYYRIEIKDNPFVSRTNSTDGVIEILTDLLNLMRQAYPECEPLRKMLRKIETSLKITKLARLRSR